MEMLLLGGEPNRSRNRQMSSGTFTAATEPVTPSSTFIRRELPVSLLQLSCESMVDTCSGVIVECGRWNRVWCLIFEHLPFCSVIIYSLATVRFRPFENNATHIPWNISATTGSRLQREEKKPKD